MKAAEGSMSEVDVSRETIDMLEIFSRMVLKWNAKVNLISKQTETSIWKRHICDSARLYNLAEKPGNLWADLGSGGGFPGIVLAVISYERAKERRHVMIEADKRKSAFLREAVRTLGLNADVICDRIEAVPPLNADVVTARALAPLVKLLPMVHRHLSSEGVGLLPKGAAYKCEMEVIARRKNLNIEVLHGASSGTSVVLRIQNSSETNT